MGGSLMSDMEFDDDEISWMALQAGTRVLASDGKVLGRITHVLGDLQEDVFDGIGFRRGLLSPARMLPRAAIGRITRRAVHLNLSAADAESAAQKYQEERIYVARGRGKRGLSWKREEDDEYY